MWLCLPWMIWLKWTFGDYMAVFILAKWIEIAAESFGVGSCNWVV